MTHLPTHLWTGCPLLPGRHVFTYGITKCLQGLSVLLALMGQKLQCLDIDGRTGLLEDFQYRYLWTVPNLQRLSLTYVPCNLDQTGFEEGMECLR